MQLCSVFLKFKKKQKTNKQNNLTDAWQVVLGTAPAIKKKKTACQNVTILTVLLLVDKWAALV